MVRFLNPIPSAPLLFTGGRPFAKQLSHVEGVALLTDADLVPDFIKAVSKGRYRLAGLDQGFWLQQAGNSAKLD